MDTTDATGTETSPAEPPCPRCGAILDRAGVCPHCPQASAEIIVIRRLIWALRLRRGTPGWPDQSTDDALADASASLATAA